MLLSVLRWCVCRYAVATADPDEVVANKGHISSGGGNEPVELDRRARSLTRSLARSAASSPLVQLLAQHRKCRCTSVSLSGSCQGTRMPISQPMKPYCKGIHLLSGSCQGTRISQPVKPCCKGIFLLTIDFMGCCVCP